MDQEAPFQGLLSVPSRAVLNLPVVGGGGTKLFRPAGVRLGLGVEENRGFRTSVRSEASTSPDSTPSSRSRSSNTIARTSSPDSSSLPLEDVSLAIRSPTSSAAIESYFLFRDTGEDLLATKKVSQHVPEWYADGKVVNLGI